MPDGQIISAPADATKEEIGARYQMYLRNARAKAFDPSEYDPESAEFKAKYGATSGMSTYDKAAANVGAGATNLWQGLKQTFTFDDEANKEMHAEVAEKRARDKELASSIKGGKALQVAGEILPTLIPGGAVMRGVSAVPRLGTLAARYGIGVRALPTLMTEGALIGAGTGALAPTTEDESTLGNALIGGGLGAALPGAAQGLTTLARKYLPFGAKRLAERAAGRTLTEELGNRAPAAERSLSQYAQRVARGVDEPPSSTAMITQAPEHGERELVARASKLTGKPWAEFDEVLDNARWDILDRSLASAPTVQAAMNVTEQFANREVPRFLAAVRPREFMRAARDFGAGLRQRLASDETIADPAARLVYGHVANTERLLAQNGHRWTPETLWRERKVLSAWLSGRPPPGMEGVRAPNVDRYILDARNAIDATLNRSSGNRWQRFLDDFGQHLGVEGQQKAGQNIRNSFVDETLGVPRVPVTGAGMPKLTEAQLRKQYLAHGQNQFGSALDVGQDEAIRTVLENLRSQGVLQRAKATMTGRGGSHTAPLADRIGKIKGGDIKAFVDAVMSYASDKEKALMSRAMLEPAFALRLLRSGRAQLSPMTREALTRISRLTRITAPYQQAAMNGDFKREEEAPGPEDEVPP
jgi:hypothetical protein